MNTKALRQKILDLAIRGKLVPQDPNDEPASVLLERIRAQKQQMVKEGKLKPKDIKDDTVIFVGEDNLHYEKMADGSVKCIEDEIPFEIPEGWVWSRLSALTAKIGAGSTPTGGSAVYSESGIKFIRSQNVYNDGLILDDIAYISEGINQKMSGSIVKPNDILLNITGGSIGRCALVSEDFDIGNVNQHVMIIRLVNLFIRHYLHCVIISPYIQTQIFSRQVGSGRGGLSAETLSTFVIPIPPKTEQQRIMIVLQDTLMQVRRIEYQNHQISDLIAMTKSRILDLAIRGKLVPQDPNDEPASVLLERIRADKEELIKQGKIKRDKKESVIFRGEDNSYYEKVGDEVTCIDEEIPFEIPDSWIWCRLNNLTNIVMGSSPNGKNICDDSQYTEFHQGKIFFDEYRVSCSNQYTKEISKIAESGSVLLCVRAPVGEVNITDRRICIGRGLAALKGFDTISENFLFYWLTALKSMLVEQATGTTFVAVTADVVKNLLVPVPPSKAQTRILERIRGMYRLISAIEANLS